MPPSTRRAVRRRLRKKQPDRWLLLQVTRCGPQPQHARAGFVTSAAMAGVSESDIARTSRRVSVPRLRSYIRPTAVFAVQAGAALLQVGALVGSGGTLND